MFKIYFGVKLKESMSVEWEEEFQLISLHSCYCCCSVNKSCPIQLPLDCGLPGSSIHGILQARILEWITITFSRGSSQLQLGSPTLKADSLSAEPSGKATVCYSLLKFIPLSVIPSNHFILCHPLLLWPSIFSSIRVFSSESALPIRWPKYWSFSFSNNPSNEYSGLISFRIDWFDLEVQGSLKSLSVLQC